MNRRPTVALALMLLAFFTAFGSQSFSQSPTQSDLSGEQQNSSLCPDGSPPVSMGDGTTECLPSQPQQLPSQAASSDNRRNSVSGAAENADITGQQKAKNSLQYLSLPPEPLTEFQKFVAATTGQLLPIYGAKLFRNVPTTFSPSDLAPVPSEYVIGPDDELRIRIWGQINYSGNLRVDRSGDIYLPEVGTVQVAGLQFSALDQHLRAAVSRVYRNFDLSVEMGRIRSMQIYVTGQARRPGVYTVSSLSTLVDALFASGGPSAQGSLRHIEIRRGAKTVADFDLYSLLIHGDKSKDARLLPEDVLYIPPAGSQVAIIGSIHSPAIYEIRDGETIGDLIDEAGKTTTVAASSRISLERLGDRQGRQAMEFPFDKTGLSAMLAGGDILRVFSIAPAYQKTVSLRGDVANAGRFAWHDGMHLSDLIPDRDSLLSRDYWWRRSHLGLPAPEFEPLISDFEANQRRPERSNGYPCTTDNVDPNSPNPSQINPNTGDPYPNIVCGAPNGSNPNNPHSYNNLDPTSPDAQDALTAAFNSSDRQDAAGYNIEPQNSRQSSATGTVASQFEQMSGPGSTAQPKRTEVKISAPEIDWNYAVIERFDPQTLKTSLLPFDLGKLVLDHDASQDFALQPGDVITVFSQADIRVPLEEQTKYVSLEGEFVHAGTYSVQPGETLRDLVRRAGGFTHKAYLYGSEFDRESTRTLQQQRIDEYVRIAALDAARGTLALTTSATSSAGTVANTSAATAAEQQLLARLKQIRATGRIVLDFSSNASDIDDVPEISLENLDHFTVPPRPATVNIVGAVYDQNSFIYQQGSSAGHYLRIAGGPNRDADSRHSFVIRADGSVVSHSAVKGPWGNSFKDLKLNPGDTIVVPDKSIRPTALRGFLDWTQIFSQLAIGAAAVEVLKQ